MIILSDNQPEVQHVTFTMPPPAAPGLFWRRATAVHAVVRLSADVYIIRFVSCRAQDRYLDVSFNDVPDARRVLFPAIAAQSPGRAPHQPGDEQGPALADGDQGQQLDDRSAGQNDGVKVVRD